MSAKIINTSTGEISPYRSLFVLDERRPARVEAAHCAWCRFVVGDAYGRPRFCSHPVNQSDLDFQEIHGRASTNRLNPQGECPHWDPSWRTRWARRLRLGRAPVMVDPRVWVD